MPGEGRWADYCPLNARRPHLRMPAINTPGVPKVPDPNVFSRRARPQRKIDDTPYRVHCRRTVIAVLRGCISRHSLSLKRCTPSAAFPRARLAACLVCWTRRVNQMSTCSSQVPFVRLRYERRYGEESIPLLRPSSSKLVVLGDARCWTKPCAQQTTRHGPQAPQTIPPCCQERPFT